MQPDAVIGAGVLLPGLLLAVALASLSDVPRSSSGRKVSLVSLGLFIAALGCIAVLNNPETMEPRSAVRLTFFAVIPICVVIASMFAASFFEPPLIVSGLFLIPLVADFMPYMSGPRNPWRTPSAKSDPAFVLLLITIFVIALTIIGCGVLYASRKVRTRQWVWSIVRGLAWGLPCGVGVMFAVKRKMALDIAFGGDYTMVWVILGSAVAITAIAGVKRHPHAVQRQSQPARLTEGKAPLDSASTDRTKETNVLDQGSSGPATQSVSDGSVPHKRRMVSGAKFGVVVLCLYAAFFGSILVGQSWWEAFRRYVGHSTSEMVGYGLLYGLPIVIGIAGLITGIQKKRPGIGVLALLTTPIGFLFALAAKNRTGSDTWSPPIPRKRPVGVAVVGSSLMVLSAFRLLTTFVPTTANNHILHMLSMCLMPVDPRDVYWMASALNLWPSSVVGARVFGYGSTIATFLIGVFLLRGMGLARWLYLGWGALGIFAAFKSLYCPLGYIILRLLTYASFAAVILRKNSSVFFSRRQ